MPNEGFYLEWSKLHGGAQISGIVKTWLRISFAIVSVLAKLGITPNFLTASGLVTSIILWCFPHGWQAPVFLALALLFDGIDGSLAIVAKITSLFGALADSIVDRISEFFWALALYRLGAPPLLLLIVFMLAATQEYLRARTGGLGFSEIGIVTVAERPIRAALIFIALVADNLNFKWLTEILWIWLVFQVVALLQVSVNAHRRMASSRDQ